MESHNNKDSNDNYESYDTDGDIDKLSPQYDSFAAAEEEIAAGESAGKKIEEKGEPATPSNPGEPLLLAIEAGNTRQVKKWLDESENKVSHKHLQKCLEIYNAKKAAGESVDIETNIVHVMYELSLAVVAGRVAAEIGQTEREWMNSVAQKAVQIVDTLNKKKRQEQSSKKASGVAVIDELEQAIIHEDLGKIIELLKNPETEITQWHIEAIWGKGEGRPCMSPIIDALAQALIDGRHAVPRQKVMNQVLSLLAYSYVGATTPSKEKNVLAQRLVDGGATLDKAEILAWISLHRGQAHDGMATILQCSNPEFAYKKENKNETESDREFRLKLFKQERRPESPIITLGVIVEAARGDYQRAYQGFGGVSYFVNHFFTGVNTDKVDELYANTGRYIRDYREAWESYDESKMQIAEKNIVALLYKHLSRKGGILSAHLDPLDDKSFDTFLIKKLAESKEMQQYFGLQNERFTIQYSILSAVDYFLKTNAPVFILSVFRNFLGDYSGENIAASQLGRDWMRAKMIEKFQSLTKETVTTPKPAA